MSDDYFYPKAPDRYLNYMKEAAPDASNPSEVEDLKKEAEFLSGRIDALIEESKALKKKLQEECQHPLEGRMIRTWGSQDTRGISDGEYQTVYCHVCSIKLASRHQ